MTGFLRVICLLNVVLHCNGLKTRKQADMRGYRRFAYPQGSVIIGAPSYPSHLPEAEPILPGHTLLRPGLGMLKSAVKFPHRELEGGSGVYGNWDNIGIRYDGKNDRVMYSGFRRSNTNDPIITFHFIPSKSKKHRDETDENPKIQLGIIIKALIEKYSKYSHAETKTPRQEKRPKPNDCVKIKDLNEAIDKTLKEWNLTRLTEWKEKYIDSYMRASEPLRRYRNDNEKRRRDKKSYDQHKNVYEKFKKLVRKPADHDPEVIGSSSEANSREIFITPQINIAVTPASVIKTKEQRKQEWFWQTRDQGNHIKINPYAPELDGFLPKQSEDKDLEGIQSWWFYNQADFTRFSEK